MSFRCPKKGLTEQHPERSPGNSEPRSDPGERGSRRAGGRTGSERSEADRRDVIRTTSRVMNEVTDETSEKANGVSRPSGASLYIRATSSFSCFSHRPKQSHDRGLWPMSPARLMNSHNENKSDDSFLWIIGSEFCGWRMLAFSTSWHSNLSSCAKI